VGYEIALGSLISALTGENSPIINKTFGYISGKPFFISQNVNGVNLKDIIENENYGLLKEIDWGDLSLRIVLNIIFCTDGRDLENELLVKNPKKSGRFKLMPLSNVEAFGSHFASLIESKDQMDKTMIFLMRTASVLFCMDSMRYKLSESCRTQILGLDVYKLTKEVFSSLIAKNLTLGILFNKYNNKEEYSSKIGIERRILAHFFFRINKLQRILREDEQITHYQLLKRVDPTVASFYDPESFRDMTLKER
jgi:hypothetical protein